MKTHEQLRVLAEAPGASFHQKLKETGFFPLKSVKIDIFQMNVGKLCNMTCKHCHVEAGPDRTELMSKATMEHCLELIRRSDVSTVDLTGGAPEMNSHLDWFIGEVSRLKRRVIVRSNLTVLKVPKYARFMEIFAENQVEVVASVPSYEAEKTDRQRGKLTFDRSIEILRALNDLGYGRENSGLVLNLVHNPVGAYLPGSQSALEKEYKRRLLQDYGVIFNALFCITNMPISRYLDYLLESGNYGEYMTELVNAFNPAAVEGVMCRNTISVGWDGRLYDCDFNQMLELPTWGSLPKTVQEFDFNLLDTRPVTIHNHCLGCTAGAGSSCQGALEKKEHA